LVRSQVLYPAELWAREWHDVIIGELSFFAPHCSDSYVLWG